MTFDPATRTRLSAAQRARSARLRRSKRRDRRAQKHAVRNILVAPTPCAQLGNLLRARYVSVEMFSRTSDRVLLTAMVRISALKRASVSSAWRQPDLDIVQISAHAKRLGTATIFMSDLSYVAKQSDRGVFVEQTITPDSRSWCESLVRNGAAHRHPYDAYGYGVEKGAEYDALAKLAAAKRRRRVSYGYRLAQSH
jgi:hypothetical protein